MTETPAFERRIRPFFSRNSAAADGQDVIEAMNQRTGEMFVVRGDDLYTAVVELARQVGIGWTTNQQVNNVLETLGMAMTVDHETQAAIEAITSAGFNVTVEEAPDGLWAVAAVDESTSERSIVEADDSYVAAVELARQLGTGLEDG